MGWEKEKVSACPVCGEPLDDDEDYIIKGFDKTECAACGEIEIIVLGYRKDK